MSKKIRNSAKGEECQVRIPGICRNRTDTTVLSHLNGGGCAAKNPDYQGAYACYECHEWLDGGYVRAGRWSQTRDMRDLYHLQAVIRTQEILRKKGLIEVKG